MLIYWAIKFTQFSFDVLNSSAKKPTPKNSDTCILFAKKMSRFSMTYWQTGVHYWSEWARFPPYETKDDKSFGVMKPAKNKNLIKTKTLMHS